MYDLVQLEKKGIPVVDIITDAMEPEGEVRSLGLGLQGMNFAVVPAEISEATIARVNEIADASMQKIVYGLTRPVAASAAVTRSADPKIVEIAPQAGEDIQETWYKYAMDRHWSDGFPVIAPTEDKVKWMLTGTTRKPDEVIAQLAPYFADATVEKIAINAVMAGATPDYLEVIIAAIAAASDPKVLLAGTIATTDPGNAPMIIVNGPVVKSIGLNTSWSVMGPGNRANSTIGRAYSLCVRNIGGADTPGGYQQHVFYLPQDYSMVLAEDYPTVPGGFAPLSVQLGYKPDANVVFFMPTDGPYIISPYDSPTQPISAINLLKDWADEIAHRPGNHIGVIMLPPEHAKILAAEGYTVDKIKDYFFRTGYSQANADAEKAGITTRGPYLAPPTFGLSRLITEKPLVANPIIGGPQPLSNTFIVFAGAPVGGHGALFPVSTHGGWAAREVGTLKEPVLPPPAPTQAPVISAPTSTPAPAATPTAGQAVVPAVTATPDSGGGSFEFSEERCGR